MRSKRLYIRLSSLGDLILATSVLEVEGLHQPGEAHWLTLAEYSSLLDSHPRLKRVIPFQKRKGLRSWVSLCRETWEAEYTEVYDLHRSLRTRLMRLLFFYWSLSDQRKMPYWKTISKQKLRLFGYYCFKKLWPRSWRPEPWVTRYTHFVGGTGSERPNLSHLLFKQAFVLPEQLQGVKYICVMPSSRWSGKIWPVEYFYSLLQSQFSNVLPVVLGTSSDSQSLKLVDMLKAHQRPHYSGVGSWNISQTAHVLHKSIGILGVDTGLPHLAEALGVPTTTIFGPTEPDMGFGPWRKESQALGLDLICRPCGKDGRFCYRFFQPYYCLKGYTVERAVQDLELKLEKQS